jgi:hypothetical protein
MQPSGFLQSFQDTAFSKNLFVKINGLADGETHQDFWKSALTCGCKGREYDTFIRGLELLRLDVQEALNKTCRLLFI